MAGITVSFDDSNIALLRMSNGQNRINKEFLEAFHKALDEVVSKAGAVGLVTTGDGKFYSNGLDLEYMVSLSPEDFNSFWLMFNKLLVRLCTFPMPTVAAINGHAFAGGALIAFAHDHRLMTSEKGWLSMNEIYMPARFSTFLWELLKAKLPAGRARTDIVTLAKRMTGPALVDVGVAVTAPPLSQLLQQATALVQQLVNQQGPFPRDGMENMKMDMYIRLIETMGEPYKYLDRSSRL